MAKGALLKWYAVLGRGSRGRGMKRSFGYQMVRIEAPCCVHDIALVIEDSRKPFSFALSNGRSVGMCFPCLFAQTDKVQCQDEDETVQGLRLPLSRFELFNPSCSTVERLTYHVRAKGKADKGSQE
jgi:hypothetical protein